LKDKEKKTVTVGIKKKKSGKLSSMCPKMNKKGNAPRHHKKKDNGRFPFQGKVRDC